MSNNANAGGGGASALQRLRARFEEQLLAFEQVRGFIERCHALADQFTPAVVKKVVADYEARSLEVVGAIVLLQPDLEGELSALQLQRAELNEASAAHRLAAEELELRLAIEEISRAEYDALSSEHLEHVQEADAQLERLQGEIDATESLLQRWVDVGQAAGVLQAA